MKSILKVRSLAFLAGALLASAGAYACYVVQGNGHCGGGQHNTDTNCAKDCLVTVCDENQTCVAAYAGFNSCSLMQASCSCVTYRLAEHVNGNDCTCGPEPDPNTVYWSGGNDGVRSLAVVGDLCTAG